MNALRSLFPLVVLAMVGTAGAETNTTTETIVWNRSPIPLALPINVERRVDFPAEVDVFVPDAVADKVQVTATPEGSVFWKAKSGFGPERMMVTDKSGRIQWLMDVSAAKKSPSHTLVVQDSRASSSATLFFEGNHPEGGTGHEVAGAVGDVQMLDEVDLVRAAARQFYGPSRLSELPPGVSAAQFTSESIRLYRRPELETVIKGVWRTASYGGDLFVTAVQVTNKSQQEVRPDPRRLRGKLISMVPQHNWLAPAGQYPYDTTIWYVVTNCPLMEALLP